MSHHLLKIKSNKKNKKKRCYIKKTNALIKNLIKGMIIFLVFIFSIKKFFKTNYIHVALNIDNNFIYPCIVLLTSLLMNRAASTFYIIHLLFGGNTKIDSFQKINETIAKFGKYHSNISYYNMGDKYINATSGIIITTAAYYRISLSSLLTNVDKIIYIDSDFINFKDLSKIYNIKFKDKMYFIGFLDYPVAALELKIFKIHTDKYINSGFLLMNLKAIRNDKVEDKLNEIISKRLMNHHDQTAINAICHNNMQILSYKYGSFAFDHFDAVINFNNKQKVKYRYTKNELKQGYNTPFLLHFTGYVKPWHKHCANKRRVYWWYYAKESLFYQEILDNYGFKREKIEELLKSIPKHGSLLK